MKEQEKTQALVQETRETHVARDPGNVWSTSTYKHDYACILSFSLPNCSSSSCMNRKMPHGLPPVYTMRL